MAKIQIDLSGLRVLSEYATRNGKLQEFIDLMFGWAGQATDRIADLERQLAEVTAEREALRAQNVTLRNAQKACENCDAITEGELRELRADAERLDFLLPVLQLAEGDGDGRAMRLAAVLMLGKSGRAAIDTAMSDAE